MNIFSNLGVTEIMLILLLALLVVGPERLPEMAQKLAKTLRDVRKAYDNLTRDLGPELTSIQKTAMDLRDQVNAVRTMPQDIVKTVVQAADMQDTVKELKGAASDLQKVGQVTAGVGQAIQSPVRSAMTAAKDVLAPKTPAAEPAKAPAAATKDGVAAGADAPDEVTHE